MNARLYPSPALRVNENGIRLISEDDYETASDAERIAYRKATCTADELAEVLVRTEREAHEARTQGYRRVLELRATREALQALLAAIPEALERGAALELVQAMDAAERTLREIKA